MSFWDTLKDNLLKPAKAIGQGLMSAWGPAGAAGGFTASQAAKAGVPSNLATRAGQQAQVNITTQGLGVLAEAATPYREMIAEPFVAASFEGIGSGLREFAEGLPGDFGLQESEVAQYVSPGQTIVRNIGKFYDPILPGEQAVNKIDFTNRQEVQDFFSKGAPKFWSGTADFGFTIGLDPFLLAGRGSQAARTGLFIRPIKSEKDVLRVSAEVDAAVAGQRSPMRPVLDFIMSNKVTSEADVLTSGLFANATKPVDLAASLMQAKAVGREAVGDVLKAGFGDIRAIQKITSEFNSARKAFLEAEQIPSWIKADLEKPIVGGEFNIPSLAEGQRLLREANDQLQRTGLVDEKLLRILKGDFEAGTEFDGLFGVIRDRTASRFEFLERARVKNAGKTSDSYWGINEYTSPTGYSARILSWLNRGNLQNEVPAGWIVTNERGTQTAFREIAANARYVQKITGQSPLWAKNKLSEWSRLTSKKARNDFIEEFEDEAAYLIIKKNLPGTSNMSPAELDVLKLLVKEISAGYRRSKYRELANTIENGYHVIDGSSNPVYVESMEKFIKAFGETTDTYRAQVKKKLEGTPLLESDVPAVVQLMDFNAFETVIKESPETFGNLVNTIKNSGLDEAGLRNQVKILAGKGGPEKAAKTKLQIAFDYARIAGDTYNSVWKPITLLRLGYAQRNVIEGGIRIPAAVVALSEELGYSKLALYKEMLPNRDNTRVAINNIVEFKRSRTGKRTLNKQEKEIIADIQKDDDLIRQTTRMMNELVREGNSYVKQLKTIRNSRLQDVDNLFKIAITKFPASKQKEYARLMEKFVDDTISDDEMNKVLSLFVSKLQNEKDLEEFGKFFNFLNKSLQNNLDEVEVLLQRGAKSQAAAKAQNIAKYPITPIEIDLLDRLRQVYKNVMVQNDAILRLQFDRATTLDRLDSLVNGATPSYVRVGESTFKVFDEIFATDAFAGTLGQFARRNSSAGRTVRTVVGGNNRDSLISNFGRRGSAINVTPEQPEWAATYADYFNTKLHNDELAVRIAQGQSDDELITWLRSPDAKTYRKNAEIGISDWGRGNLEAFVQAVRLVTERNIPDLADLNLRQALITGNLTPQQALRIPQDLRVAVKGFEVQPGKVTTVSGAYKSGVNLFFKYLGSLPEDVFLRHPLYRSIYRNEIRSLSNLVQSQGKELTSELLESLARQAHVRANKVVTETLYTVERFTTPAEFFRYASPFWMAQQNSAKFWLGESIKNPRLPYLGLLGWNSVNEALTVRDSDEYNRRAGGNALPVNTGEQIWVTLPSKVAKAMGIKDMNILKISKDSANLVAQGAIPLLPGLGSPIQVPASILVKSLVGKDFDPDKELNKLGPFANIVREAIFGPQIKGAEGLLPSNAWIRNGVDYFFYEQSPRYWQRVNLIVEKRMLAEHEAGNPITEKVFLDNLKEAQKQARNTFAWGILFGVGGPVSTQLGNEYELFKSEYRLYTRPVENGGFGPVEGAIKFEEKYGSTLATYARSSLSYNPAGLLSNNATIKNILDNKELFEEVFLMDSAVAGALVNTGTMDDFSPVAYKKLFEIKVAGQPLRSKKEDVGKAEKERQENAGWAEWIKAVEYYDAQMLAGGIKPGTKAAEPYEAAKRQTRELIGKDFPIWYQNRQQELDLSKAPTINAINTVLNSDNFNKSKQAKSPLWQGLREWAQVREYYADAVQREGRQQANEAINSAYQESARLITLYYPEFGPFFERYLKRDVLDKVQIRLK